MKGKKSVKQPHARKLFDLKSVKKCGAKTRSGYPCQQPAMKNGRCRLHGGKSTGPPIGNKNAQKHGFYSREKVEMRRKVKLFLNDSKKLLEQIKEEYSPLNSIT